MHVGAPVDVDANGDDVVFERRARLLRRRQRGGVELGTLAPRGVDESHDGLVLTLGALERGGVPWTPANRRGLGQDREQQLRRRCRGADGLGRFRVVPRDHTPEPDERAEHQRKRHESQRATTPWKHEDLASGSQNPAGSSMTALGNPSRSIAPRVTCH